MVRLPRLCEDALKKELVTFNRELATSCVECVNLQWDVSQMMLRMKDVEVDVIEVHKAVLTSLAGVLAQVYKTVKG